MIKIFFIRPHNEILRFLFDTITIGTDSNSDIIIPSNKLNYSEIYLTIRRGKLEISTKQKDLFYLHNGKKVSGNIKLKPQDIVSFDSCEFRIINFSNEVNLNNDGEFEKKYQNLTKKENFREKEIIEVIEKNMFILEKERD